MFHSMILSRCYYKSSKNSCHRRLFCFQIFGLIIFGISIAGILEAQSLFEVHSFVVVLVFIIFMGILSAVRMMLQVFSSNS